MVTSLRLSEELKITHSDLLLFIHHGITELHPKEYSKHFDSNEILEPEHYYELNNEALEILSIYYPIKDLMILY